VFVIGIREADGVKRGDGISYSLFPVVDTVIIAKTDGIDVCFGDDHHEEDMDMSD